MKLSIRRNSITFLVSTIVLFTSCITPILADEQNHDLTPIVQEENSMLDNLEPEIIKLIDTGEVAINDYGLLTADDASVLENLQTDNFIDNVFILHKPDSSEDTYFRLPVIEEIQTVNAENAFDATQPPSMSRAIIGTDDRTGVVTKIEAKKEPNNKILLLNVQWPKNKSTGIAPMQTQGNAWMISPSCAVTAAHVVYNTQSSPSSGWCDSFTAYAGKIYEAEHYDKIGWSGVSISSNYTDAKAATESDFAVIYLDRPFGAPIDKGGVGVFNYDVTPDTLTNSNVTVNGYEVRNQTNIDTALQRYHVNKVTKLDSLFLQYTVDTASTQSGSPIYTDNGTVVGIHVASGDGYNKGIRISPSMKSWFSGFTW